MNILAVIIFSLVTFLFYKTYDIRTVVIMVVLSIVTLFFTQPIETVAGAGLGIITGVIGAYITKKKRG